jgi:CBS domain-containing protein
MELVKDWMSSDFKIIRDDMSPPDAIALLAGDSYGVVENASQQMIGLVTASELEGAIAANKTSLVPDIVTSPQLLKVGSELEMQTVVNSPLLKTLVQETKVALVIDDANSIIGLLTADAIRQFIHSGASQQKGTVLGNDSNPYVPGTQLEGAYSPLTAVCICFECWHDNTLSADQWAALKATSPEPRPICQNPDPGVPQHLLKLS